MKFKWKVMILSLMYSLICMCIFTYACSFVQKTIYVYQVGIYKEESNKNAKIKALQEEGIQGYCYRKDNQYYVLSMISENQKDIQKHATNVKGIMKSYIVSYNITKEDLLKKLEEGMPND